jgi:hypothetical protein
MSSEASKSPGAGLLDRAVARYHEILAEGDTARRSIETMRGLRAREPHLRRASALTLPPAALRNRLGLGAREARL